MKYLKSLQAYSSAKINYAVGLMSGTSADAVDGALVKFSQDKISLEKFISLKYKKDIQDKILNSQKLSLSEISELNFKIAENFADCAEKLANRQNRCYSRTCRIGNYTNPVKS